MGFRRKRRWLAFGGQGLGFRIEDQDSSCALAGGRLYDCVIPTVSPFIYSQGGETRGERGLTPDMPEIIKGASKGFKVNSCE